jgi:hypothetical protein
MWVESLVVEALGARVVEWRAWIHGLVHSLMLLKAGTPARQPRAGPALVQISRADLEAFVAELS